MTTRLKPITPTSWIVINDIDENRIGLLTEIRNQYILMVKGEKRQFIDRKEVNKFFNENIFDNVVETKTEEKKQYYINGYPVNYDTPLEVFIKGNKLPLYSKKQTSDVVYSAGYYCLGFPKLWMPVYCPKLSTLELYPYAGPFVTEEEMKRELSARRREKKKNE